MPIPPTDESAGFLGTFFIEMKRDVKNEFSHPCFLSYEEDQRYSLRLWKILPSTETAGSALTMEL